MVRPEVKALQHEKIMQSCWWQKKICNYEVCGRGFKDFMTEWNIELEPFQESFFYSIARFPNMTSSWGTGKTMVALTKGLDLSGLYPGNKGLILRENFTDLKDSTMADFEEYTKGKYKIRTQGKDATIPCGKGYPNSTILFHHADELGGVIQNINLGWFYIEQAEEFDNDEVFEKLGGRLRRILTPRIEVQQKLVAMGALREVVKDFRELDYEERLDAESAIITKLKMPLRQGIVIANANGHNWNWRKFINIGGKECIVGKKFVVKSDQTGKTYDYGDYASITEANTYQNTRNLPADFVASLDIQKETAPCTFRRFVMNSHEETDTADKVIPYQKILEAVDRDLRDYDSSLTVVSCDPAEFGDDRSQIYALKGLGVVGEETLRKKETMETAGHILVMREKHDADVIAIDDVGVGAGVRSRLRELVGDVHNAEIMAVNFGSSPMDSVHYVRLRDQIIMEGGQLFKDDYTSIPNDADLIEELASFTYSINSRGQMMVARKKDIKKVLGRSPDKAESLFIGLWAAKKGKKRNEFALTPAGKDDSEYDVMKFGL